MDTLLASFIDSLRVRGYAAATLGAYRRDVGYLARWAMEQGADTLLDVDRGRAESYTRHVLGCDCSAMLRYKRLSAAYAFYRWLHTQGHLLFSPFVRKPAPCSWTMPRAVPDTATIRAMYERLAASRSAVERRDYAIIDLAYSSGLRVGELAALNVADVQPSEETIRVRGKFGKQRLVPVGSRALAHLLEYLYQVRPRLMRQACTDALFVSEHGRGRLSKPGIEARFKRLRRTNGWPETFTPHCLRHAFATDLLRNGAAVQDVAKMLGHVHLRTTTIYTRLVAGELRRCHQEYHPRG